jgi:carbonic anhydrase
MKNVFSNAKIRSGSLALAFSIAAALSLSGCASRSGGPSAASRDAVEVTPSADSKQALEKLVQGNQRFAGGSATHPGQTVERRTELAKGQTPFAIVLTCADSRVSPELVFDQGLGDLFVIRNAGNVLDDHVLGSMEYAVDHLHVPLIVVLGHSQCGAVSATLAGGHAPGHIQSIVDAIGPAVAESQDLPGDKLDNAVRANAERNGSLVAHSGPILEEAVKAGKLRVVAARYDLATGRVEFLKIPKE